MTFILLIADGDEVELLSRQRFSSRGDALEALRGMSEGPEAERIAADEVLIVDLDAAAPVLMIPAVASPSVDEADAVAAAAPTAQEELPEAIGAEPAADAWEAPVVTSVPPEEPLADSLAALAVEGFDETPDATAAEGDEEPQAAREVIDVAEAVEPDVPRDEPVETVSTVFEEPIEAAEADESAGYPEVPAVEEPTGGEGAAVPDKDVELAAALQAAAEQFVADGVPEPEPVPAPVAEDRGVEAVGMPLAPDTLSDEVVTVPMSENEVPPPPAAPEEAMADEIAQAAGAVAEQVAEDAGTRGWPWELEGRTDARGSAAEEEEPAPADMGDGEAALALDDAEEVAAGAFDAAEPEAEPAIAYEPGAVDMQAYTCDDCVYEETCPKKGEQSPAECGSFQWRST